MYARFAVAVVLVLGASVAFGIAIHPSGRTIYVANFEDGHGNGSVSAFRVESNGSLTLLNVVDSGAEVPKGVAVAAGGRFLYVSHGAQEATEVRGFEIGFDGTLTEIEQLDFGFDLVALAFGLDGRNLYVADFSGHTVRVFTVDALGNLAPVQSFSSRGPSPGFQAVAVQPAQRPLTTVSHPEK